MYESKHEPLLPRAHFIRRVLVHFIVTCGVVLGSLILGIAGYQHFERLGLIDAFLNSAMLLGGMGPVDRPNTDQGKIFAGLYALYAGGIFLVAASIMLVPAFHRLLHKFHWDEDQATR